MIIKFTTKVNRNGNTYGLIVNTDNKTYHTGYGLCGYSYDFKVKKCEIENLVCRLIADDYKRITH